MTKKTTFPYDTFLRISGFSRVFLYVFMLSASRQLHFCSLYHAEYRKKAQFISWLPLKAQIHSFN